jgi:phosphonate transport system substrate-binding protein
VLLAPEIEANREEKIRQALINAPPTISASINLLTNAPIPEYDYLIEVVERVRPLADKINGKPVQLY